MKTYEGWLEGTLEGTLKGCLKSRLVKGMEGHGYEDEGGVTTLCNGQEVTDYPGDLLTVLEVLDVVCHMGVLRDNILQTH